MKKIIEVRNGKVPDDYVLEGTSVEEVIKDMTSEEWGSLGKNDMKNLLNPWWDANWVTRENLK